MYFPSGPVTFATLKKKFQSDLTGAPSEHAGFVFITNQTVTPAQRKVLSELAKQAGKESVTFHRQTLQTTLDSPPGYGVRIQYLEIPMTIEEQLSWASDSDTQTAKALAVHSRELVALKVSIERLTMGQEHILQTISQSTHSGVAKSSAVTTPDLLSVSSFVRNDSLPSISALLTPQLILLFHRLACFDLPNRIVGRLRTEEVWLGNTEGARATHIEPPPANEVQDRLESLCADWNRDFGKLRSRDEKLSAVARFHTCFLVLHPFLDGNGRVARALLMQQCLDLFGKADMTLMNRGAEYYSALKAADSKKFDALIALIEPITK